MTYDVVVAGAGLAGLTAGVRAAQGGARVLVLAKGIGATHLAAGTVDVLGYAGDRRIASPAAELASFAAEHPGHPYASLEPQDVAAALAWFADRVAKGPLAPYAYRGGLEDNFLLPTAVGAAKPTALAPQTMVAGDLRAGEPLCLVGLRALRDFYPALAAGALRATGVDARPLELDMPVEGRADVNALGLADAFEDSGFRARVVAALVGRLAGDERIGMPAALGLRAPHGVWADLQDKLGRPVFEIPTLPPSVPGIRLYNTLRDALQRAGGRLVIGAEVVGAIAPGGRRLEGVRARVAAREQVHRAAWLVLASGGFASGGLELDSSWRVRESLLDLPVSGAPAPDEARFASAYFGEHPLARAGVATDAGLRPLDAGGERVYDNVLVVGATLAGAQPWREKSGDGISLATGYKAAGVILDQPGAARVSAAAVATEA